MAKIYIIAGPPGIGKSTAGRYFIPHDVDIFDPDEISNRYKQAGFVDYKDIGNLRFRDMTRQELVAGIDFGIELNLGFQSHYDFVKNLKNFGNISLIVVLFFSDDINICYRRVTERHFAGLHLVSEEIIKEMYDNTIELLMKHFHLINHFFAINIEANQLPDLCLELNKETKYFTFKEELPIWLTNALFPFLKNQVDN